jgi:hypothetical protein
MNYFLLSDKYIQWLGYTYIHTRVIPEGVAEASQIILQDAHVLSKLFNYD